MLSKEERKAWNTEFWNEFKKEMRSVKSSNGKPISWLNYPTDVKDTYLRMNADGKRIYLSFDIQTKDEGIRAILWEQMTELKVVMEQSMGKDGIWNEKDFVSGQPASRIVWSKEPINFFDKNDWETIKDFFKAKLLAFDKFYQEFKEILISLAS